jgi:tetrahydromethanopterin S-methyltransferase subunit A
MYIHANVVKYVIQFNVNAAKGAIVFLANVAQDATAQNAYVVQIVNVIHVNVVLNVI